MVTAEGGLRNAGNVYFVCIAHCAFRACSMTWYDEGAEKQNIIVLVNMPNGMPKIK